MSPLPIPPRTLARFLPVLTLAFSLLAGSAMAAGAKEARVEHIRACIGASHGKVLPAASILEMAEILRDEENEGPSSALEERKTMANVSLMENLGRTNPVLIGRAEKILRAIFAGKDAAVRACLQKP